MSKKIGRNDPCPCGSGKKYKNCCLGRKVATTNQITSKPEKPGVSRLAIMKFQQKLQEKPEELEKIGKEIGKYSNDKDICFKDFILGGWTLKKVRKMSTSDKIEKLESMNIDFEIERFKKQAQNYISAIQLAEDHYYTQNFQAPGQDEDFIWLAIMELWNRIIPEKFNIEMIDDFIQDGYEDFDKQDSRSGIEKWEKAWNMIMSIVPPHIKSVKDADKFISGLSQSIFNWCKYFGMELAKAAVEDDSFHMKRIKYCQDFCRIFPDSDKSIIKNMLSAEAESYTKLGDLETAKKLSQG
ncbi:MAG: SEC-C metal-binding domain-containing protein [Methanosarcina sp.]|nr:SEC-C metal-binding domain-containing protein [Methanosarcina sp.]